MALARDKLGELERRLLAPVGSSPERVRPRIRVLGDLQLLPPDVRVAAARVMTASRQGECSASTAARQRPRPLVNLCVAYTGREDLAQAAQRCAEGVAQGWLQPGDVGEVRAPRQPGTCVLLPSCSDARDGCVFLWTQDVLEACLHTSRLDGSDKPCMAPRGRQTACLDDDDAALVTGHVPVDLLIRTSGEHRLSDFAVAQCGHAQLHFTAVLWPDLGFTHLAAALLRYQAQAARFERRAGDALQARRKARERAHLLALCQGGGGLPGSNGHGNMPSDETWRSGAGCASPGAAAFEARYGGTDTCCEHGCEDATPAMPPPTPAEEATLLAQAQGAAARVAAFLQERERALRAWEAAVAEGRLVEWPPPLGPKRKGCSKTT